MSSSASQPITSDSDFTLGHWKVFPSQLLIVDNNNQVSLRPLHMSLLVLLAQNPGQTLSRELILEQLWPGKYGADESLSRTMSELRSLLGKDAVEIKTVPKKGYVLNTPPNTVIAESTTQSSRTKTWLAIGFSFLLLLIVAWFAKVSLAPSQINSIAVLPFSNFTEDARVGFIADGLIEEVTHQLTKSPGILVAARTSAFYFRSNPSPISKIGELLNVTHILEGSVREEKRGLRVTAQLIDTRDGYHIWSNTFDLENTTWLEVQKHIVDEISFFIGNKSTSSPFMLSPNAQETYLLAQADVADFGSARLDLAKTRFTEVLKQAPDFTPATIGLATSIIAQVQWAQVEQTQGFNQALALLDSVAEREHQNPDYHLAMALLYAPKTVSRRHASTELSIKHFEQARALNPNDNRILSLYANYADSFRKSEDAFELLKTALHRDPYNAQLRNIYGNTLTAKGQYPQAKEQALRLIEDFPESELGQHIYAIVYRAERNYAKSAFHANACIAIKPSLMDCYVDIINAAVISGDKDFANQVLEASLSYAPALQKDVEIMQLSINNQPHAVLEIVQQVTLAKLYPPLTQHFVLWALSVTPKEALPDEAETWLASLTDGDDWFRVLYRAHWQKYKLFKPSSELSELAALMPDMKDVAEQSLGAAYWYLSGLILMEQTIEAQQLFNKLIDEQTYPLLFGYYFTPDTNPFIHQVQHESSWAALLKKQQVARTEMSALHHVVEDIKRDWIP